MNRDQMIEAIERVINAYRNEVDDEDMDTNVLAENIVMALNRAGLDIPDED